MVVVLTPWLPGSQRFGQSGTGHGRLMQVHLMAVSRLDIPAIHRSDRPGLASLFRLRHLEVHISYVECDLLSATVSNEAVQECHFIRQVVGN